jgi:hypothetical protein
MMNELKRCTLIVRIAENTDARAADTTYKKIKTLTDARIRNTTANIASDLMLKLLI